MEIELEVTKKRVPINICTHSARMHRSSIYFTYKYYYTIMDVGSA